MSEGSVENKMEPKSTTPVSESSNVICTTSNSPLPFNVPRYGTAVPNRIFVGGISPDTTEEQLAASFATFGKVSSVNIIVDRARVSKGYGFVTFESAEDCSRAIIAEVELNGRKLNIAPAVRRQSSSIRPCLYDSLSAQAAMLPSNGLLYSNGFAYSYHNGLAIFGQNDHRIAQNVYPIPACPTMVYQSPGLYTSIDGQNNYGHPVSALQSNALYDSNFMDRMLPSVGNGQYAMVSQPTYAVAPTHFPPYLRTQFQNPMSGCMTYPHSAGGYVQPCSFPTGVATNTTTNVATIIQNDPAIVEAGTQVVGMNTTVNPLTPSPTPLSVSTHFCFSPSCTAHLTDDLETSHLHPSLENYGESPPHSLQGDFYSQYCRLQNCVPENITCRSRCNTCPPLSPNGDGDNGNNTLNDSFASSTGNEVTNAHSQTIRDPRLFTQGINSGYRAGRKGSNQSNARQRSAKPLREHIDQSRQKRK